MPGTCVNKKNPLHLCEIRMVAEQTAAYQKQMWLSQLQVTNPQAYQVTLLFTLFTSWYHLHPWVLWNYFSQPFAPFLEPVPEGVTSVNEFSVPAPESKNSVPAPNLNIQFLHHFFFEADELALFLQFSHDFSTTYDKEEPTILAQSSHCCLAYFYILFWSSQLSSVSLGTEAGALESRFWKKNFGLKNSKRQDQ